MPSTTNIAELNCERRRGDPMWEKNCFCVVIVVICITFETNANTTSLYRYSLVTNHIIYTAPLLVIIIIICILCFHCNWIRTVCHSASFTLVISLSFHLLLRFYSAEIDQENLCTLMRSHLVISHV